MIRWALRWAYGLPGEDPVVDYLRRIKGAEADASPTKLPDDMQALLDELDRKTKGTAQ